MKISDLLDKEKPTLSFEFFPPKTEEQETNLFDVISSLKKFDPDFVSVTYGAMGTTRDKTFYWAQKIKRDFRIEPVVHLTCIAANKINIKEQLDELENFDIQNILALRGDPPKNEEKFISPENGFSFAKDLVSFIKKHKPNFSVGVAGYPEIHPTVSDQNIDINHLKQKTSAGAAFIITQLFFDNNYFFDFLEKCKKAGITVPIIPGIMPITSLKQIEKITTICGAKIPKDLSKILKQNSENISKIEEIGIDYAIKQCKQLLQYHVPGIHFFVMNQSGPISKILSTLAIH